MAMTSYSSYFEALLENLPNNMKNKGEIRFEIYGEGNLPRFTIVKPTLRNKKSQPLMLFKRSVINHTDSQQLVLSNDGTLPTKVNFFLYDPDAAFKLKPTNRSSIAQSGIVVKDNDETVSSVVIQPGAQVYFTVSCTPKNVQTYQASLQLTVTDNQFEDTLIQLIGEGFMKDIIFENLHSLPGTSEFDEDVLADEDVAALKCNSISFGDIYVNDKKQLLFTMKNQSKTDCYRFEWPASQTTTPVATTTASMSQSNAAQSNPPQGSNNPSVVPTAESVVNQNPNTNPAISFSPRVGHLHAGCAKDITVTFKSAESRYMQKELFNCLLNKVTFEQPINEVKDWDDRMTLIKWVNEIVQTSTNGLQNSFNDQTLLTTQRQLSELGANLPGSVQQNLSGQSQSSTKQVLRKKVIETEPEPRNTRSDEIMQPLELFISANCDFCRFRCKTNAIRFKDTLMFQTRVYE